MSTYQVVASTAELEDTGQLHVQLDDAEILLVRDGENYHAINYYCSHETFTLEGGMVQDGCIVCPYHGAEFCLADGSVKAPPAWEDIRTWPVRVEDNLISIAVD